MESTQPHAPEPAPPDSGTVRLTLSGDSNSDLFKAAVFIEGVLAGDKPGNVLDLLHLAAIRIISQRRRGRTVTLTLLLEEAA